MNAGCPLVVSIPMSSYILELVVTDEGVPFYPAVGTVEHRNNDNAGYDLKIVKDLPPTTVPTLVPLGVRARMLKEVRTYNGETISYEEVPCHFSLEPRSSIYKTGFMMVNSRGIIDRTYTGELKAPVVTVSTAPTTVPAGTRLFQIIAPDMGHIDEVRYMSSLPETTRGEGGFGSTGAK